VLSEAVEAGGSTLRDYLDADARPGGFGPRHRVYGRGGLACLSCGGRLRSAVIAQRTTVWCGTCQK
jgi:formamidopyrimidine-DNA glycosylase